MFTKQNDDNINEHSFVISDKLDRFKKIVICIWIGIFFAIFIFSAYFSKRFSILLLYITLFIIIFKMLKNYIKDSLVINRDSIISYIVASGFFLTFVSADSINIYLENFAILPYRVKEILLLIFLTFKIILLVFFILINISISISNTEKLFGNIIKKTIAFIKTINFEHEFFYYNFYLSKSNNKTILFKLDIIIFIISCPIFILLNLFLLLLKYLASYFFYSICKFYDFFINFCENKNVIIKTITKLSMFTALIYVYLCIIYNSDIFSTEIKEAYSVLVTVVLIPLIYDSIKNSKLFSLKK